MTQIIVALDNLTFSEANENGTLADLSQACEKNMIWGVKVNDMLYSGDATKIIASLKNDMNYPAASYGVSKPQGTKKASGNMTRRDSN